MTLSATDLRVMFGELKAERSNTTSNWQEYARYVWPDNEFFWLQNNTTSKGQQKNLRVYDSTPEESLEKFSALMQSMLTPHSQRWHTMEFMEPALNEDRDARLYLDEVTRRLFNMRYEGKTGFQHNIDLSYRNLGVYGTQALFVDYNKRDGVRYHTYFMGDIYIKENFQRRVDTVFRRFDYTPQQALEAFGADKLPDNVARLAKDGKGTTETHEYVHIVMPNDQYEQRNPGSRKFVSIYLLVDGGEIIDQGYYDTMPYIVSRFSVSPFESYGRGPTSRCFPDVKSLQAISRTVLRSAQKLVDPPILAFNDNRLSPGMTQAQIQSGGIVPGGVDENGRQTILPFNTGSQIQVGHMEAEEYRNRIKSTFYVDMFEIFMDKDRMTATEFIGRNREKNVLLSPAMNRQQAELLAPLIERELDVAKQMGILPEKPPVLEGRRTGIKPVYESSLNRLQKAEELQGMQATLQEAIQLAQINPEILDNINDEQYLRLTAEGHGAPEAMMRSIEEIEAMRQQRAQQQQAMAQAQMAPQIADANLKNAKAQQALAETG